MCTCMLCKVEARFKRFVSSLSKSCTKTTNFSTSRLSDLGRYTIRSGFLPLGHAAGIEPRSICSKVSSGDPAATQPEEAVVHDGTNLVQTASTHAVELHHRLTRLHNETSSHTAKSAFPTIQIAVDLHHRNNINKMTTSRLTVESATANRGSRYVHSQRSVVATIQRPP